MDAGRGCNHVWTRLYTFVVEPMIWLAGMAGVLAMLLAMRSRTEPVAAVLFIAFFLSIIVLVRRYGRRLRWRCRNLPLARPPEVLRIPDARLAAWEMLGCGSFLVLALLLAAAFPFMNGAARANWVWLLIAPASGALALCFVVWGARMAWRRWRGLDKPSDLVADERGLMLQGVRQVFVPWSAIRKIDLVKVRVRNWHIPVLALQVEQPERYGLQASAFQRLLLRGAASGGGMNVGLADLSQYMPAPADSVAALRVYWSRAVTLR